jgi:hypothetical protein
MQKTLKRLKVDLCDLLGFILSGRIAIVGRKSSARGLERLRLSKADIGSLAVEREERRLQGRLGMPEVAAHLGLSDTNIVTALTRIGLLQPSPPVQTRTGKRTFSESDVAAFSEFHISQGDFEAKTVRALWRHWRRYGMAYKSWDQTGLRTSDQQCSRGLLPGCGS